MNPRVAIIGASAGTGKTHRLTEVVVDALSGVDPARPEGVVAITYTRRAAAELSGRIRRALMAAGAWEAAGRCRDGYIGTIHAVCDRLLREFPLEAGLPPDLAMVDDGSRGRLLDEAVARAIHLAPNLDALATRCGQPDWTDGVRRLVQKARSNGMTPDRLRACALDSVEEVRELLGEPPIDDAPYARDLWNALNSVRAVAQTWHPGGARRIEAIEKMRISLRNGEFPPWGAQAALAEEVTAMRQYEGVAPALTGVVGRHGRSRRFHDDMIGLCDAMFVVAAAVAEEYDLLKRQHRVLDYDDMLALALRALDHPAVAADLAARLDLVVVDEFQDTSPLQLAILLRLAQIAPRSTWVGDPKQAIYGFQGTDPELMTAAMAAIAPTGAADQLRVSRRSRPTLVRLVNEVFRRALEPHGHRPEHVAVTADRVDPPELADEPALEVWNFHATRTGWDRRTGRAEGNAIADGIASLLRDGFRVVDELGAVRPGRGGDIAVLLRRNRDCAHVADALRRHGVASRVHRDHLLEQAEVRLVRAGLALLADPAAIVPAMDLAWLSSPEDPDAWLAAALPDDAPFADHPWVIAIRAVSIRDLTPIEAFDRIVEATAVTERCAAWPDPARRIANIEALRAEVRAYQDECGLQRRACTVRGLVSHLEDMEQRGQRRYPRDPRAEASGRQAMPNDDEAVTVLTYHAAKGLEWRVVVLGSLDHEPISSPFEVDIEPALAFDPLNPLSDRRVRWWPNPYAAGTASSYGQRAAATAAAVRRAARDAEEHVRLLYVGFTRARDRLVLSFDATDAGPHPHLAALRDATGAPILGFPTPTAGGPPITEASVRIGAEVALPCRVRRVQPNLPPRARSAPATVDRLAFAAAGPPPAAEIVVPSAVELEEPRGVTLGPAVRIGDRIAFPAFVERMNDVGNAIHAFLGADDVDGDERLARAIRALSAFDAAGALSPSELLRCGDGLRTWIADQVRPTATWREWPVRWALADGRLLIGEIDLILDVGDGLIVIDHKAFPGEADERDRRAIHHAGQLAAYRAAAEAALGKPVKGLFLHFPLRGEMQEVHVPDGAFARTGARRSAST